MKIVKKTVKLGSALLGLGVVLAVATVSAASPTSAVPLDTGVNVIVVRAQDVNDGQIVVDSVTAAQDGWLLIRKDHRGAPGDVIGFAPVHRGTTTRVRVDIQPSDVFGDDNITPTLWATLVADPNAVIPFASPGPGITEYTSVAVVAFASSTALGLSTGVSSSAGAANGNKIIVRAQDANTGQIIVDSVSATQDGWLLIRKDRKGAPGDMIGFAPVHRGTTTNIRVDIQTSDVFGDDNITLTLWATLVADPNALFPLTLPDPTITERASMAVAAFGGTLAGPAAQMPATSRSSGSSPTNANKITVRDQDTSNGQVIVDTVTAAQDGWLLIHKDANGRPGGVLGFVSVRRGLNTKVTVDIKTTNAKGDNIVTRALWATLLADPNALVPFALPDLTAQPAASLATVAFFTR